MAKSPEGAEIGFVPDEVSCPGPLSHACMDTPRSNFSNDPRLRSPENAACPQGFGKRRPGPMRLFSFQSLQGTGMRFDDVGAPVSVHAQGIRERAGGT